MSELLFRKKKNLLTPNASVFAEDGMPIINSLMDTDMYKIYMLQPISSRYMAAEAKMKFLCRDSEDLIPYIPEIIKQVKMVGDLRFTSDQLSFLENKIPALKRSFVKGYLRMFKLFPEDVSIREEKGQVAITTSGNWAQITMWEIIILAIVSEIRNKALHPNIDLDDIRHKLSQKVSSFYQLASEQKIDLSDLNIADFGTRRRLSFKTQFAVVDYLKHAMPDHFVGTSNVHIARELDLKAIGTQAHEWWQAHQALSGHRLIDSQKAALQAWADEYRGELGDALTDCISMDAFLNDFDKYFSLLFSGMRHDSGCPFEWGEKAIAHYEKLGIDPKTKTLIFSDGLKLGQEVLDLYSRFKDRINVSFGIGTNLTCDVEGVKPMNIVMKMVELNDNPVAKLSDSPGKSMCDDQSYVEYLKKVFKYDVKG
ncbi:nicotinate phosphoribosyltransferase [Psychromonas sp. SP041]|uniref:nicotinate phosphoribosyltransferase n=1 Tax=Psychromonas sp. SP041 TaxID=1365007 RepID=UPI0010C79609|nr:nicotinate phosphoribosyltransferase [Psychromonas sp. SP041]